jgi:hypothetical protein
MTYLRTTPKHRPFEATLLALVVAMLLVAGCGDESDETATTSAPTTAPTTTAAPPPTTAPATTATTTSTVTSGPEPPIITLAGWTTIYSQDGVVHVEGWLDRPGRVTVGDVPAETYDDPYNGLSTFAADLELDAGEHAIEITAVDAAGLENSIFLGVFVDPELELEFGYLLEVDLIERTLVVDDVEFLTGAEAKRAAVEDGAIAEGDDLPNDFYVRNQDPQPRTSTLGDPDVIVLQACLPDPGPCVTQQPVGIDMWAELLDDPEAATDQLGWSWYGYGELPYWFTIQDGYVIQIHEQYLP